jgi:hypothetical protein
MVQLIRKLDKEGIKLIETGATYFKYNVKTI